MEKDPINKPQAHSTNSNPIDESFSPYQCITTKELAEKLSISLRNFHLRRKDIEKFIPPIRIGKRSIRYRVSDVVKFLERGGIDAE
jgi:predicted DNA-binding transcriptional regulator AlpA